MKNLKSLCLISAFAVSAAFAVAQQPLSGSWKGELKVTPQVSLKLVINLAEKDGATVATMDSPDQNAYGIPAVVIFASADSINVSVTAMGANYAGRLADGRIHGTFRQGMAQFPLELEPGKVELKRPQTPQPPFPYTTEEVHFTANVLDSYAFSGTLTLPEGWTEKTPMVVMVTGSGTQNRDEEIMGHRPFAVIADYLARHGIGSLRYDDRGYGIENSTANLTTESNARDAQAAVNYLRGRKFRKVGVLGHSEGGEIAFMLADGKEKPSFIVTLGAPAVRGDSLLVDQNRALMEAGHTPQDVTDSYTTALQKLYAEKIAGKTADVNAITAAWPPSPVYNQLKDNLKKIATLNDRWMDFFISYSPAKAIATTKIPALALYGEKDIQVRPALNAARLKELSPKVRVKVYPGLNHLMQTAVTGLPTEYGAIEERLISQNGC